MSFIYGIINLDGTSVSNSAIEALGNAVRWEGFKDETLIDCNYAIGYCHHPERAPKAGIYQIEAVVVIADIRIYNNEELSKSFDFETPEEAFAKAYLRWGSKCAEYINGDFAVAVFDGKQKCVYLFRDHIGTRPLVYWFNGNRLVFGSHEFGLAKSGLITTSICEEKLINQLFHFSGVYAQTALQNILKVIPGYSHIFSINHEVSTKYWEPEKIERDNSLSYEEVVLRLKQLIVSATIKRIEPGKTGVHVSGGIDSGGVAAILADQKELRGKLFGYSWSPEVFKEECEGVDEKVFIEAIASEKVIPVKYLKLTEKEAVKDALIPEFETQHIEHPTMKMAGRDEVKTLFSGWGGDEFVSLSTRGTFNHLFFRFKWLTLLRFISKIGIKSGVMRLFNEVILSIFPFKLLYFNKDQATYLTLLRIFKIPFVIKHSRSILFSNKKLDYGFGNRKGFALKLLYNYHLPERMDSWAIHSERYGFEYKYPLLDKELMAFWFSIPVEHTYRDFNSRLLFREAMKGILPELIRTRKDKGEGLRLAYSRQNRKKSQEYIKELFEAIPERSHLNFICQETLQSMIQKSLKSDNLKMIFIQNQPIIYLRYLELKRKYLCAGE